MLNRAPSVQTCGYVDNSVGACGYVHNLWISLQSAALC
jgi:hypothetical protein